MIINSANNYKYSSLTQKYPKAVQKQAVPFTQSQNLNQQKTINHYNHPVNKWGEYSLAVSNSFKDSLAISFRAFYELFSFDTMSALAQDDDNDVGAAIAIMAIASLAIGAVSMAVTLPPKLYEAHVNYFKKAQEMDVYVRNNSTEVKLLERMDTQLKNNDNVDCGKVSDYLAKIKMADNNTLMLVC